MQINDVKKQQYTAFITMAHKNRAERCCFQLHLFVQMFVMPYKYFTYSAY